MLNRKNNQEGGFTRTWTYDNAGNILSRNTYAYTTGELGAATDTVIYTYGDTQWGDLLTAYNGNAITYDAIGNPLSDGTWNYTWQHGRQLASMTDGETSWTYTYNADGLRTKRTDGTNTYTYAYYGGVLRFMEKNGTPYYFTTAPDGTPMGIVENETAYYYVTNLQGDVVGIVEKTTGQRVVTYTYDAWGNVLSITGSKASTLGKINPIRYRGYVYDTETGLYYLQSRYYNPEIGRFINADGYTTTGQGLLGSNIFTYCLNNSVGLVDPTGNCPHDGRFYTSGVFAGQFEYNPGCALCAPHGEFYLYGAGGVLIDMVHFDLTNEQKVLVATMAAEATVTAQGKPVSSQARQAMANVALNRIGQREWSKYKSVSDVCKYTGFDGYGTRDYFACMAYLDSRDGSNATYEAVIWDVLSAYSYDITNGCQIYYTPAAMPNGVTPPFNYSLLTEVTIYGVDQYYEGRFFRYK